MIFNPNDLIGLTCDEADEKAKANGHSIRSMVVDGRPMVGTADYRPERINVEEANGIIVAIRSMG